VMNFTSLLNQEALVLIPRLHLTSYYKVKIIGVDVGGIWIESQSFTQALLHAINEQATPRTPVFFLPYHEIAVAIASIDVPGLDEKAFGV
jgi:hypothetical protein